MAAAPGKSRWLAWLCGALWIAQAAAWPMPEREPEVQPKVDLQRYTGRWYEIARLPNRFQEDCVGEVTADYQLLEAGRLRVVNQCSRADGRQMRAEGVARPVDDAGAKLEVRFAPALFSFLPFVWGDYWILELAPDYSYALVGSPDRAQLWILSRTPSLNRGVYQRLVNRAALEGYDVARLRQTRHEARLAPSDAVRVPAAPRRTP